MSNPFADDQQPQDPYQEQQAYGQQQYGQQPYGQPGYPQGAGQPNGVTGWQQPGFPVGYAQKSKIAAALLAFFLGTFGAHNFYLGYKTKAWWQLGLSIFGYVTLIFIIGGLFIMAVGIWAFVEFIMILAGGGQYKTDANGVPLSS